AIDALQIAREGGHGQLPLLLAASPGVQVAQSGLFDFNVNARGFNEMVNRRVRIEVDGRETSQPHVLGNTDWASLAGALDEYEQIEFVRGPGGALYGTGALNGVLSLRSKDPAASRSGRARITVGELGTVRIDARDAVAAGRGWFLKGTGGYQQSGDFAVSRVSGVEYEPDLLPREAAPLSLDRSSVGYASVRADKYFSRGEVLVFEGGSVHKRGPVTVTNLGRYQATDADFPWGRAELRTARWRIMGAITSADIDNQRELASGGASYQSGSSLQLDVQTNRTFASGRGRTVGGGSYGRQRVDSADANGTQTIFERPESAASGALFGQIDYDFTRRLKGSLATRLDATTLTRTTLSPRLAAVFEISSGQRLRAAFSDAFKAPTLAEVRLRAPIAAPVDLSSIEAALRPVLGGARLAFDRIGVLAVGNEHLDVEEVRSVELGYSVALGRRTFVQAAYYRNHHDTFTSGLLPQVGTSFGRLNPSFGPYRPPAGVSAAAATAIESAIAAVLPARLAASLSNFADGRPVFAVLSLGNFGSADSQGLELSGFSVLPSGWRLDASYAWFGSSIRADSPETPLSPNTPRHQISAGLTYVSPRFDIGARYRWVDAFEWVSGVYTGPVPAYGIVDAQANIPLTVRLKLGVNASNLLDNRHYEMFGGDVLRRRALAHVTVTW
ncbi:MAG: TonB-dependent receptor, partial [Acidobacteriota bacterium]|nr:TonB-dependent receptor [Acidobacteriota bacterium]